MKPHEHFLHIFTPRHTNNHRPKILHISGLAFCLLFLLVFQLGLTLVHQAAPQVLGYASNITISDLLSETNARRASAGVGSLSLNGELANAAAGKAQDMFNHQYWAHVSPEGKEPWDFITGAGYNYVFAGENLARDFGDSKSVVDAWMNSPSHKENLLNDRFKDVGFAVVNGKYGDSETTLVVQMFGARAGAPATVTETAAAAPTLAETPIPTQNPSPSPLPSPTPVGAPVVVKTSPPQSAVLPAETNQEPEFDILTLSKDFALALTGIFLLVLIIDAVLVHKRKTVRISGHNYAHMLLLFVVIIAVALVGRGLIL